MSRAFTLPTVWTLRTGPGLWTAASWSIQTSPSRGEGPREEAGHPQTTALLSLLLSFKSYQAKNSSFHLLPGQHGILIIPASVSLLNPQKGSYSPGLQLALRPLCLGHTPRLLPSLQPGKNSHVHTETFGVTCMHRIKRKNMEVTILLILVNNYSYKREAWKSAAQEIPILHPVFTLDISHHTGFSGYSC